MTRALAFELALLTLLAATGGAAMAVWAGGWGWSWDAMNHHVYLGLVAEQPRWSQDVLAASYQSYQHPYLYWPVYRIALLEGDGLAVAAAWAALQAALLLQPVWWCAHHLLARSPVARAAAWEAPAARAAACLLAFANGVVLLGLLPSMNDLLAAWPLLCGIAWHLGKPEDDRRAGVAAALWGCSVALKWSNGLMVPLLLAWAWHPQAPHLRWRRVLGVGSGAALGFALVWAPWGWQLWQATGNPFYPYFGAWFGGPAS